jgi:hypothetical protein
MAISIAGGVLTLYIDLFLVSRYGFNRNRVSNVTTFIATLLFFAGGTFVFTAYVRDPLERTFIGEVPLSSDRYIGSQYSEPVKP